MEGNSLYDRGVELLVCDPWSKDGNEEGAASHRLRIMTLNPDDIQLAADGHAHVTDADDDSRKQPLKISLRATRNCTVTRGERDVPVLYRAQFHNCTACASGRYICAYPDTSCSRFSCVHSALILFASPLRSGRSEKTRILSLVAMSRARMVNDGVTKTGCDKAMEPLYQMCSAPVMCRGWTEPGSWRF